MTIRPVLHCLLMGALLWCVSVSAVAENMIGRQSQNEGLTIVPVKTPVTVDGKLGERDWSGRIWVFADTSVRSRYSVEAAGMWDEQNLYLAFKWKDPSPMFSTANPAFDPDKGWMSDAVQLRVNTGKDVSWLTLWYYTPDKVPALHISRWSNPNNCREGQQTSLFVAQPGKTDLGSGIEMAYRMDDDGKGFVQEVKMPWSLLYASDKPQMQAGMYLRMGMEFLWGNPDGFGWPAHRYADNMAEGQTSREFYWSAKNAWGKITLSDKNEIPVRKYIPDGEKVEGSIPVRVTIPKDAARFTVAIDDAYGKRIRNLAGDGDPLLYKVSEDTTTQTMEVLWDGLDDKGHLVEAGTYVVCGLSHNGLSASYERCFYNPGTPAWPTSKGNGTWGSDHCNPEFVARAGDGVVIAWRMAEGGSATIGIGADGLKKWGEKRGTNQLAADATYSYGFMQEFTKPEDQRNKIYRLKVEDGSYAPFIKDGKELPFELDMQTVTGSDAALGEPTGIAVHGNVLAAAFMNNTIVLMDANTADLIRVLTVPSVASVAFAPDGTLYGVSGGNVVLVDQTSGKTTSMSTPGVGIVRALAVDNDGNLVVLDTGKDLQVKAYSPKGKLVYTCGKKGGRPLRGDFDPQAMMAMSSVAVDAKGQVWVTESWEYPRRVSVWGRDGKLVRDYVGNTGYSGTGAYLHDDNPELAYVGPIEIKLDKASRNWSVSRILWVPDLDKGEPFLLSAKEHANPQRFTATVGGKAHEYMFAIPYRSWMGVILFLETKKGFQPVSAVATVGYCLNLLENHRGKVLGMPQGDFADLDPYDSVIWNDTNRDSIIQRSECEVFKTEFPSTSKKRPQAALSADLGWGGKMGKDLVFYTSDGTSYAPVSIDPDGAPRYGKAGMGKLNDSRSYSSCTMVPVPSEHRVLAQPASGLDNEIFCINTEKNTIDWTYPNPYPGVHGSHRATMPAPGLVIGPLKICGVADLGGDAGKVFLMRGNLGQDFVMTTDGLYVGAIFQDGRLPRVDLPDTEEQLLGVPMETYSHGGEPFNGWFGRQADGIVRTSAGFVGQAAIVMQMQGWDSLHRFAPFTVAVSEEQLAAAQTENLARQMKKEEGKAYSVQPFDAAPVIDANAKEWNELGAMNLVCVGQPARGTCKVGHDAENLYALFEISDDSPWMNNGKDFTRLFKTGDAVDLQLSTVPDTDKTKSRSSAGAADVRILIARFGGKDVAVLMKPVDPSAPKEANVLYTSPVGPQSFDRVEILQSAEVKVRVAAGSGYVVEAKIPLKALGMTLTKDMRVRADAGFITSDKQGTINTARIYWSNKNTNLVNDLPQEAKLSPSTWAEWVIQ